MGWWPVYGAVQTRGSRNARRQGVLMEKPKVWRVRLCEVSAVESSLRSLAASHTSVGVPVMTGALFLRSWCDFDTVRTRGVHRIAVSRC